MTKTVIRKWTTKAGITKQKTYTYDASIYKKKIGKAKTESITFATGRIKKSKLNKLITTNLNDKVKTASDKLILERDIQRLATSKGIVSIDRAIASFTGDRLHGMLANTGYTVEELARQANTSVNGILKADNWSADWSVFTNESGEEYRFNFTDIYENHAVMERI